MSSRSRGIPRSSRRSARIGRSVIVSPATQANASPGHHSASRIASSSSVVVPGSAPPRCSQRISTPSGACRSCSLSGPATSTITCAGMPEGSSSRQRAIAGSAVSSPASSSQSVLSGSSMPILGPASQIGSPGAQASAQAVATPALCTTTSIATSVPSNDRTV